MRLSLLAGPTIEPVSLAEAKQWLRLDESSEDDLLSALIVSARLTIETFTRRSLITQIWRMTLDSWPQPVSDNSTIAIPFAPFQRAIAIRVYGHADVTQTVSASAYLAPAADDHARIAFLTHPPEPGQKIDGIEIDIVVGYGDDATDAPEPLRRAILMLVAYWRENRGDAQSTSPALSPGVQALAKPFRRERLI